MKTILFTWFFLSLLRLSFGSCYRQIFQSRSCTSSNGITIPVNGNLRIQEKCLDCSCSTLSAGEAIMSCCGYGIHAGIMVPPNGCKIITEADGCTPKSVSLIDGSPCPHK